MSSRTLRKQDELTRLTLSQKDLFFNVNGVRKRKIYFNVDYTRQEENWIVMVRKALKKEKGIEIEEDQVLLRFYYSSEFQLEQCMEKLEKYHQWFTNPEIQKVTDNTRSIFRDGFVYCYSKAKDGRVFIIMDLSVIAAERYTPDNYYQSINYVLNKAVKEMFVPGSIETYYFVIDLNEQLLTLPLTSFGNIVKEIANVYCMRLEKMFIVNCTTVAKWIYNRINSFISEDTASKISLFTKDELEEGLLKDVIGGEQLERKYGGFHANIDHSKQSSDKEAFAETSERSQTEYFSIEQNQEYLYYKEGTCCGNSDQCSIY